MVLPIQSNKAVYSALPVNPATNASQSFGGGWGAFLDGVGDTFGTLMDGALKFEQYRNAKDASGQGQQEVVTAVTRPAQTNAAPINEQQYQAVANGAAAQAPAQGVSNNTALMIGGAVVVLVLLLK